MFTATADRILPTTVTGSWPRPTWFEAGLWGRPLSDAMLDISYREQLLDAVVGRLGEQERAGLDIVTNGDYHLDPDLAGLSWMRYPLERIDGLDRAPDGAGGERRGAPPGHAARGGLGAWRLPTVAGRIGSGAPLEFDKLWRIAQSRTDRPVKFGTVSTQLVASMLDLRTDAYAANKRELMWDMATAMNVELRQLVAAGCKVIQIEEPLIHFVATQLARSAVPRLPDRLLQPRDQRARGRRGLGPHLLGERQHAACPRTTSYAEVIEIYLDRVGGDVWTVEMKDRDFADLELFSPYRDRMTEEARRRRRQPPHAAGRDARRGGGRHPLCAQATSTRRTSCSPPTAASGGRARTGSSPSTSRPRSCRGRTSCGASSGSARSPSGPPIRRYRSTRRKYLTRRPTGCN